jgi:hypothetical protein
MFEYKKLKIKMFENWKLKTKMSDPNMLPILKCPNYESNGMSAENKHNPQNSFI